MLSPALNRLLPERLRFTGIAQRTGFPAWCRDLIADRTFWGVVLIWAFCWFSWAMYLERFANSLPWCDEYAFILSGVATRERPVTWEFLWTPANEHRAPLTRLSSVELGRLFDW